MYLCISWSRTRKEKPVDYQDVRGEFRHVPPAITQLKTPLFGGVSWFSFAKRFKCQAFMFSIPNLFHVNIMITNLFFVKNNSIVANSSFCLIESGDPKENA